MNLLYNIGIQAYICAAKIAALGNGKIKKMIRGQKRTFDTLSESMGKRRPVWIHASSLGEFEQGRPLIERIRQQRPDLPIVLTFFSPSGYEVRKNYDKADTVAYLPFDTPRNARRFLDIVNPSMAIFIKYEFWGNYLQQLKERGIPTYLISAIFREGQIFFKPCGGMFRRMLRCFNTLYIQDSGSKGLLDNIGITNTAIAGDTRFDRVTDIQKNTFKIPEIESFFESAKFKIIIGSSWEADEDIYTGYINSHPEVKAVIAPHEMDGSRLSLLARRFTNGAAMLSEIKPGTKIQEQVIIADSYGKLASLYRYGDIAYIGGGFGAGIHNINEAAVYSIPVIFGPRYHKFKEARDMISLGGAFTVKSSEELRITLDRLYKDTEARKSAGRNAGKYIRDNLGATDHIFNDIF